MPSCKPQPRFVPSEDIGVVTEWHFGAVGDWNSETKAVEAPVDLVVAPSLEELLQQAREEAYQQGFEQAQSETAREWQMRLDDYVNGQGLEVAKQMQALAATSEAAMAAIEQHMASEVLALACDIARQVVRRELQADPEAIKPVVQQALEMLVTDGRPAVVRLHPSSLGLIQKAFQFEHGAPTIQWIADASLQPDDCLVSAAGATVDGTLNKRWARAVAALGMASAWNEGEANAE